MNIVLMTSEITKNDSNFERDAKISKKKTFFKSSFYFFILWPFTFKLSIPHPKLTKELYSLRIFGSESSKIFFSNGKKCHPN